MYKIVLCLLLLNCLRAIAWYLPAQMSQTKVNDAPVDVMCTLFIWRILCFLRLPPLQIKSDESLSVEKGWRSQKCLSPHNGIFCILCSSAIVQWSHPCTPQKPCHPSTFTRPHRDREYGWGKAHKFWQLLGRASKARPTEGPAASTKGHPSCVDRAAASNTKWRGDHGESPKLRPLLLSVRGEIKCCC